MSQRDLDWLQTATPEQIDDALQAGDLAAILSGHNPPPAPPAADSTDPAEWNEYADQMERHAQRVEQGARGPQPSRSERGRLADMSPDEIIAAQHRGELDSLLRGDAA